MSLNKGLAYLVYLESLGHCDQTGEIREHASSIVDLEQVLIHFISENDSSSSAQVVIGRVQAMTGRR